MAIIERSVSVSRSIGFSVCDDVHKSIHVLTRPPAVSLRPRLSNPASSRAAQASPTSRTSSLTRTRPMSIITSEVRKTSIADDVCAGKITAHDSTTGSRMGLVPSRQILRCAGRPHRKGLSDGTIRMRSILLWHDERRRASSRIVATFNASEGWNWNPATGIHRAAPLVVAPMK